LRSRRLRRKIYNMLPPMATTMTDLIGFYLFILRGAGRWEDDEREKRSVKDATKRRVARGLGRGGML
jgi:siroheme synthase (precorrin-2 oxidase/ferrochelatase)